MDYSKHLSGSPEEKLGQLAGFAETCARMTEKLSCILLGEKVPFKVIDLETGEEIIPANRKLTRTILRRLAQQYGDHLLEHRHLVPIYSQLRTEDGFQTHLTPWKFDGEDAHPLNRKVFSLLFAEMTIELDWHRRNRDTDWDPTRMIPLPETQDNRNYDE